MNRRTLSDSSTSESEDDAHKIMRKGAPHIVGVFNSRAKSLSTSESEDDSYLKSSKSKQMTPENKLKRKLCDDSKPTKFPRYENFKRPSVSYKAESTEDDSADEGLSQLSIQSDNFKKPVIELSESESEGHVSEKASMPTFNNFSGRDSPESRLKSGIGQKLMAKMGYTAGKGLGKYEQGRTEIVEASKQRGRRGLGLHLKKLEPSDAQWDFDQEQETVEEEILWMPKCSKEPPDISELRDWMSTGEEKLTIDDETKFCDPDVLSSVLVYKAVFDELESDEMRKARTRSNPFETIRGGIFLNRAAMKMANIDACFDFMFTQPKNQEGELVVSPDELLYFADVCAGPGGFSEYILWRRKWESKGFGFTLKGPNDFKLEEFFAGPPETFEPYYGVNGIDGDGDIYVPENLKTFQQFVLTNTDNQGVHFVMADGGFSVEGKENIQEILSKRLYLCQFLCALMILRIGGHFVCKLFDLFTPFSVGLVYLMYRSFENVCIHKPNTSRPANSERYIICKWRRENTTDVCDYLFEVNNYLANRSSSKSKNDILEVVPFEVLNEDADFLNYIVESNNSIGTRQIRHLDKIRVFASNVNLHDHRQSDFRKQCLEYWQVPDQARSVPPRPEPEACFRKLMKTNIKSFLTDPELLTNRNIQKLKNIFDYKVVVCGETTNLPICFFLSLGRSNIYRFEAKTFKWRKVDLTLELPAETLFYGQLINELRGEGKAQRKVTCIHIIDALFLGSKDVRKLFFEQRMVLAGKLAKAVSKPSRAEYAAIKAKEVWSLQAIDEVLNRLTMKSVKSSCGVPRLCFEFENGRHFIPSGLLIFNTVSPPWVTAYSKSQKQIYYFNVKDKRSATFVRVDDAAADFMLCFSTRIFWSWEKDVKLLPEQRSEGKSDTVHGQTMYDFVMKSLNQLTGCTSH